MSTDLDRLATRMQELAVHGLSCESLEAKALGRDERPVRITAVAGHCDCCTAAKEDFYRAAIEQVRARHQHVTSLDNATDHGKKFFRNGLVPQLERAARVMQGVLHHVLAPSSLAGTESVEPSPVSHPSCEAGETAQGGAR